MTQLNERIAIVTGASRGIGRGIALELARRGATVIVNYQSSADAANEVVGLITADGGKAQAVQADVGQEEDVTRLIKTTVDAYGKVDILVNNAGTTRDNLIMRMDAADFDTVIQTNLRSTWLCSKAVARDMMRKRYGRIINITSVSGIMGQGGQTNYSASKAGIIGLTKALAREIASRGITVNAVAPGFIDTDMTKSLPEDAKNAMLGQIALGRFGEPADIARAVAFLAGPSAAYITGETLHVNGGMYMP
jgi:3-oxoacyl-[acyl-carrier protein] reductase